MIRLIALFNGQNIFTQIHLCSHASCVGGGSKGMGHIYKTRSDSYEPPPTWKEFCLLIRFNGDIERGFVNSIGFPVFATYGRLFTI